MKAIYQPKGRAREYSELAVNLYRGCPHGCTYCYAPLATRKDRERFHADTGPRPGIIEALRKDAAKTEPGPRILLCFTCDPYPPGDSSTTREAISIIKDAGHSIQVLTKGGLRAVRDYDLFDPGDAVATTMTFLDSRQETWEPRAARPGDRMDALRFAHQKGIETWVSLEPVIDPAESLRIIDATHEYVDLYKIGVLNYSKLAGEIDWKLFAEKAVERCDAYGVPYYLKEDLRKHLEPEAARADRAKARVEKGVAGLL